jgi:hypothetical protein
MVGGTVLHLLIVNGSKVNKDVMEHTVVLQFKNMKRPQDFSVT